MKNVANDILGSNRAVIFNGTIMIFCGWRDMDSTESMKMICEYANIPTPVNFAPGSKSIRSAIRGLDLDTIAMYYFTVCFKKRYRAYQLILHKLQ